MTPSVSAVATRWQVALRWRRVEHGHGGRSEKERHVGNVEACEPPSPTVG